MIKRKFFVLFSVLLSLVLFVNVNTATQNYIPRNVDIDRSKLPKNILIGSYIGGRSHLKPMLDITEILIERGYNVILLTTGNYTPSSEYPNVKQISLGPRRQLRDLKKLRTDIINKEFDFERFTDMIEMSLKGYDDAFEKYRKVVKDYNIDLFFCDGLLNDVCLDTARSVKKPVVGFTSLLNVISPITYKSDPILRCNISLENASLLERFKCSIMRPIQMFSQFQPFVNQLNDKRKKFGVESGPISLGGGLSKTSLALVDTFFGLELPQSLPPHVQEIGPILPDEYPPLTPELSDFMNKHERVLYIAFGTYFFTTVENNNKILQSLVEAIDKNLFDGIIWPLSQTLEDDFSSTLTLTNGTQIQTSSILNNEHPHIHITKFAPQFTILNHANTKLFFSHGGAGSVHESLYTGTPMLVLPLAADQMGIAQKLESSGVALKLSKLKFDVNEILNKMNILLNDESIKKNLKRLEVLAKINSKRKHRAADLIEYILHSNSFNEGEKVNEEFLKEWVPADNRMGFIKGNNFDIYAILLGIALGFIGGILWVALRFVVTHKILSSISLKSLKSKSD